MAFSNHNLKQSLLATIVGAAALLSDCTVALFGQTRETWQQSSSPQPLEGFLQPGVAWPQRNNLPRQANVSNSPPQTSEQSRANLAAAPTYREGIQNNAQQSGAQLLPPVTRRAEPSTTSIPVPSQVASRPHTRVADSSRWLATGYLLDNPAQQNTVPADIPANNATPAQNGSASGLLSQTTSPTNPAALNVANSTVKQNGDRPDYWIGPTEVPAQVPLAAMPQPGEFFSDPTPELPDGVHLLPYSEYDFSPDPIFGPHCYDPEEQASVYAGKRLNATQRPLIELGRKLYYPGPLPPAYTFFGNTNLITPQFLVYGDYRTAIAANRVNGDASTVWAHRLNLDFDLKLTSTERFHAFMAPLDNGAQFTRMVYDGGEAHFINELDAELDTGFFEGDLGSIWGGMSGEVMPFTLPFAAGVFPIIMQNGYWVDDAFLGLAATIPARNSATFDISNYDLTFFAAFDKVNSPAFGVDDNAAKVYGFSGWYDMLNGYVETGYAFVDDRRIVDRSYHNVALAYSRRYGAFLSNSVRVIANSGQDPNGINQTADGVLLVLENSLISTNSLTIVPYFNLFAGFGSPQSVARAGNAGGILKPIGINFETDGLTGYPTLDASGNNTWGGAFGLNLLPADVSQQLVVEAAFLQTMKEASQRIAPDDQYGLGVRYQMPISNSIILRTDAMYGFMGDMDDVSGVRMELRHKF